MKLMTSIMTLKQSTTKLLHNQVPMPLLGFGTYQMKDKKVLNLAVKTAIKSGYRLIDTATVYRNEQIIGDTLKEVFNDNEYGIKREDIFITSKLAPADQGFDACYQAVLKSLEKLQLEYIDCYLIHWPGTSKLNPNNPLNTSNRIESWRALEKLYEEGKLKSIGVSNYQVIHLQQLMKECKVSPHVIQNEMHPCYFQRDVLSYCDEHNIFFQAYSSLGVGKLVNETSYSKLLEKLAGKYNATIAQLLLRWGLQKGVGVIPKSNHEERIKENCELYHFQISKEDMDELDQFNSDMREKFCWDSIEIQ